MTDEELCALAKESDGEAWNALLAKYDRVAFFETRNYFAPGLTQDDLLQEARFGFIKAVRDFRAGYGAFRPFAVLCIRRQVATTLKTARAQKRMVLNNAFSIDKSLDPDDDAGRTLEAILADKRLISHDETLLREELAQSIRDAVLEASATELSHNETLALTLYIEGKTYADAAALLGRNLKHFDNALHRARSRVLPRVAAAVRVALGESVSVKRGDCPTNDSV